MVRIGEQVPHIRVPALADGTLTYFDWERLCGQWVVLCCLPSLGLIDAIFLDHQCDIFAQYDAKLATLCQGDRPLHHSTIRQVGPLRVAILADPLRRLHRAYGLPSDHRPGRCHTFLIDPNQILRFELFHDLNARGMKAILHLLSSTQQQEMSALGRSKPEVPEAVSWR